MARVPLLEIRDLRVNFETHDSAGRPRIARALNGVTFDLARGEILGLVGETGAGKSLTASAILGLVRPPGRRESGRIVFDGQDLTGLGEDELQMLRGARIALVVQSPRTSLDPLTRVGAQIARAHQAHRVVDTRTAYARAVALLASVGILDAPARARAWPHELSGGMAQRVLIAMALVNDPDLVIADEPTTGLDATVQAQVLELLREKTRALNAAALIITHDLGIVAQYCERVAVMYAGHIVEQGSTPAVFAAPRHPYTARLLASAPDRISALESVPRASAPPDLYALPGGCAYRRACARVQASCETIPGATRAGADHEFSCHHPLPP